MFFVILVLNNPSLCSSICNIFIEKEAAGFLRDQDCFFPVVQELNILSYNDRTA